MSKLIGIARQSQRQSAEISKRFFTPASLTPKHRHFLPLRNFTTSHRAPVPTTAARMVHAPSQGSAPFLSAVATRGSFYALDKSSPIPDSKVIDIVQHAVRHAPSAFNSQSARTLILFGADHTAFWDIALNALKAIVSAEQFEATRTRINGFSAARGTVLFFEDQAPVKKLQEQFPTFAAGFPEWSAHSSGMHQFVAWTALEAEGLGANLQHYNPLVDEAVYEKWNVPRDWKLVSQLVFGGKVGDGGRKERSYLPIEDRVKISGLEN